MKGFMKKSLEDIKVDTTTKGFRTISELRSLHYLGQYTLANIFLGRKPSREMKQRLPSPKSLVRDMRDLLRLDAEQMARGTYSSNEFTKWTPIKDLKTAGLALLDLLNVKDRAERADGLLEPPEDGLKVPKYYAQAFHYQTDGWLSERSADIYDYQVETLFGGSAGAMRRQALIPLLSSLESRRNSRVKILDLAAGTGVFSREIKSNLPEAHLTVCDLSPFYLKKARQSLAEFTGVDFVEANAESLPFPNNSFDAVVCVYLFHELPKRVRSIVAGEIKRVLKPGASLIFVDSIQKGDKQEFDGSLEDFPSHYHEPYYSNYIEQDLRKIFTTCDWSCEYEKRAFLSKVVQYKKL